MCFFPSCAPGIMHTWNWWPGGVVDPKGLGTRLIQSHECKYQYCRSALGTFLPFPRVYPALPQKLRYFNGIPENPSSNIAPGPNGGKQFVIVHIHLFRPWQLGWSYHNFLLHLMLSTPFPVDILSPSRTFSLLMCLYHRNWQRELNTGLVCR